MVPFNRLGRKTPGRRYGQSYGAEVHRILGLKGWRQGDHIDVRDVALIHRRALSEATRAIDPKRRMGLTPFGVAELEHYQMENLIRLLQYVGITVAAYNDNEETQRLRQEHIRAQREQLRERLEQRGER